MGRKRKVQNTASINGEKDNASSEQKTGMEEIHCHADQNSNTVEAMNIETTVPPNSNGLPPKKTNSNVTTMLVRRSCRLRKPILRNGSQKLEPSVEHVNLAESKKQQAPEAQQVNTLPIVSEGNLEEEAPQIQELNTVPVVNERNLEKEAPQVQELNTVPVVNERNLEGKVDYIVRAVDEFKSKSFKQVATPNEGPSTDLSYKSLYIDSQKAIEALMEKHYELVRKLEFANGKIDAYEKMFNTIGTSKEVILVSRLEKDAEAVSLSPKAVQGCISNAAPADDDDDDQNASPIQKNNHKCAPDAANDHKLPPMQKRNYRKRKAKC